MKSDKWIDEAKYKVQMNISEIMEDNQIQAKNIAPEKIVFCDSIEQCQKEVLEYVKTYEPKEKDLLTALVYREDGNIIGKISRSGRFRRMGVIYFKKWFRKKNSNKYHYCSI